MNVMNRLLVVAASVLAIFFGYSAVAKSPFQVIEFEFPLAPEWVSCLGEPVSGYVWVTLKSREFETPSGNYHYIEYWIFDAEWIGQDTSRVWLGKGQSPGTVHTAKGEVGQWTSRELARPVVGDGPKFRYNMRFKYTVNANGDLKVFYEPPVPLDDWIRCLGPKD